ncbi:hypothetical protein D3C78_1850850 [compost metagenome]
MRRCTSSALVLGDTLTGASSMMERMVVSPAPPWACMWRMISRNVSMPVRVPNSMITSEPMSCSLMVCTAWDTGMSGDAV